jgi:hypothetical protein
MVAEASLEIPTRRPRRMVFHTSLAPSIFGSSFVSWPRQLSRLMLIVCAAWTTRVLLECSGVSSDWGQSVVQLGGDDAHRASL